MTERTPLYRHSCPDCVFLGRYTFGIKTFDLYKHLHGYNALAPFVHHVGVLVARSEHYQEGEYFGEEHGTAESVGDFINWDRRPPLAEALYRSREHNVNIVTWARSMGNSIFGGAH